MDVDAYWFEDEVWQGFLPTESRSALLERHVFQTYVAGLTLTPDPDNAERGIDAAGRSHPGPHRRRSRSPAGSDRTRSLRTDGGGLRVNLGILVSREPLTLSRVPDSDERAAWAARAVAKLKAILAESHEPVETTGDPMEQMRRMAEDLRRPDAT
jgi:hypothetical protein